MRLTRIFARFYKSFNFDHLRKAQGGRREPWEMVGEDWYPFVEIPLDSRITAVVGANESGKSQLLGAIRLATFDTPHDPKSLCRYSDFFGVEEGQRYWPHVGAEWSDLSLKERQAVQALAELPSPVTQFRVFRTSPEEVSIWIGQTAYPLSLEQQKTLAALLPEPFSIDPDVALPSTIPLHWLTSLAEDVPGFANRQERAQVFSAAARLKSLSLGSVEAINLNATALLPILSDLLHPGAAPQVEDAQRRLVENLLFEMGRIDRGAFDQLVQAIAQGDEGWINGLVEKINQQIAAGLNLRRWWVQDREFSLRVSVREHDLSFTIRDRTGTEYAFDERSHGLRYFLSYLIQSQSARARPRPVLLLMDEPDAHLSAEAQQDLLRIFDDLAETGGPQRPPMQVVYVTHSPFLLDKNHAERIRVLEKGRNLEGTRVIRDAAHNHYEPLRSAFGTFVGETAFIGAVNLVLEGPADQILLAGASRAIRRRPPSPQQESLDLNRLVLVPAGSASQAPYMVHLIRGRDAERPPVLVLLDSDAEGDFHAQSLREEARFRKLIPAGLVMQIGDVDFGFATPPREIEDLLPIGLAVAAANRCLADLFAYRDGAPPTVSEAEANAAPGEGLFDRVSYAAGRHKISLGKVALARAVTELADPDETPPALRRAVDQWLERMRRLFIHINAKRRDAEERNARSQNAKRVEDRIQMFAADHPHAATREEIDHLIDAIFIQLDDSPEADAIRQLGHELRVAERLRDDPAAPVADLQGLYQRLHDLRRAPELIKARLKAETRRAEVREVRQTARGARPSSRARKGGRATPQGGATEVNTEGSTQATAKAKTKRGKEAMRAKTPKRRGTASRPKDAADLPPTVDEAAE